MSNASGAENPANPISSKSCERQLSELGPPNRDEPGKIILVDLPIRLRSFLDGVWVVISWMGYLALWGVLAFLAFDVATKLGYSPSRGVIIFCAILVIAVIMGLVALCRNICFSHFVQRYIDRHLSDSFDQICRGLVSQRSWLTRWRVIEAMTKYSSHAGFVGNVLRVCRDGVAWPVRPVQVRFEERPLDESDSSFRELYSALYHDDGNRRSVGSNEEWAENLSLPRRIWRNIRLKEGRISLLIITLFLAGNIYRWFITGQVTFGLIMFLVWFLALVFWPATSPSGLIAWFVLPGGVIIRIKDQQIAFNHYTSTLSVCQVNSYKWRIAVANTLIDMDRAATKREVELLLSSWFSPPAAYGWYGGDDENYDDEQAE